MAIMVLRISRLSFMRNNKLNIMNEIKNYNANEDPVSSLQNDTNKVIKATTMATPYNS